MAPSLPLAVGAGDPDRGQAQEQEQECSGGDFDDMRLAVQLDSQSPQMRVNPILECPMLEWSAASPRVWSGPIALIDVEPSRRAHNNPI